MTVILGLLDHTNLCKYIFKSIWRINMLRDSNNFRFVIYLLYRIRFFYKEGNYNQVKSFVSILIFITTVLVLKQFYDYKYITFEVYYNISLVVGLLFLSISYWGYYI